MNAIVPIPILNHEIMVHFGDMTSLKKELISRFGDEKGTELFKELHFDDSINGKAMEFSTGNLLLWLPEIHTTIDKEGVLAHEIFHVAITIMLSRDISLSRETEELCAYIIEYLTIQIYELIVNKNGTIKEKE